METVDNQRSSYFNFLIDFFLFFFYLDPIAPRIIEEGGNLKRDIYN